jgi:hypothetical protein
VVHEGRGIYYGVFPGDTPHIIWVVSRPHNWRPSTSEEFLLQIDVRTGQVLSEKRTNTRFTHDAVSAPAPCPWLGLSLSKVLSPTAPRFPSCGEGRASRDGPECATFIDKAI